MKKSNLPHKKTAYSGQKHPIKSDDPILALPPFKVQQVFTGYSETIDWGISMMGIPSLWRQTKGENIVVAVLDTGAALEHPDLKDAILEAKDFTGSQSGPGDVVGHGSHVAGIIAARENSSGVIGVAPSCKLLIGKVLGDAGHGTMNTIISGIDWAVERGADIVVMSLGCTTDYPELKAAVDRAIGHGVFVIAAAGNEGPSLDTVGFPARYDAVIAVGSIDRNRNISTFSSRGHEVDIVAPGDNILSTFPPKNLAVLSGSSMAAPFVAGACALMLSKHRAIGSDTPIESPSDLLAHLKRTATDLGTAGVDPDFGAGLINPEQLLSTPPADFVIQSTLPIQPTLLLTKSDLNRAGLAKLKAANLSGDNTYVRIVL